MKVNKLKDKLKGEQIYLMNTVLPKVSIIIPVYNVAAYLRQCLDSIVNQTFKDIEIICVNDGSTDTSPQILAEYAKNDDRIQIIMQENQGVAGARNTGIARASGDYLMFIDSDDYIEPDMVEVLYNCMIKHNPDVVVCDVDNLIDDDVTGPRKLQLFDERKQWFARFIIPSGMYELKTDLKKQLASVAWNKLYKTAIIRQYDITFPPGLYEEDEYWLWAYMIHCKSFYYTDRKLYHYVYHKGSVMDTLLESERSLNIFDQYRHVYECIAKYRDIAEYREILARKFMWCVNDRLQTISPLLYPKLLEKIYHYAFNCDKSATMQDFYRKIKQQTENTPI